jgi:hypothetical protein
LRAITAEGLRLPEPAEPGQLAFADEWYPVQVKQKSRVGRPDIDLFEAVMTRERRTKGFFVGFDLTADALHEIRRFAQSDRRKIVPLCVREILSDQAVELVHLAVPEQRVLPTMADVVRRSGPKWRRRRPNA